MVGIVAGTAIFLVGDMAGRPSLFWVGLVLVLGGGIAGMLASGQVMAATLDDDQP